MKETVATTKTQQLDGNNNDNNNIKNNNKMMMKTSSCFSTSHHQPIKKKKKKESSSDDNNNNGRNKNHCHHPNNRIKSSNDNINNNNNQKNIIHTSSRIPKKLSQTTLITIREDDNDENSMFVCDEDCYKFRSNNNNNNNNNNNRQKQIQPQPRYCNNVFTNNKRKNSYNNRNKQQANNNNNNCVVVYAGPDNDEDNCSRSSCGSSSSSLALSEYIEKEYIRENNELDQRFIPPLIMHAFHLPGYTYWQDWKQYMLNNHPVLGICCHHPRHPITGYTRIATVFGSALFGLFITNAIYLAFLFTNQDYNKIYTVMDNNNTIDEGGYHIYNNTKIIDALNDHPYVQGVFAISNGNIALWTIGVTVHALYDNTIWSLAACACFMAPGMKVTEKMKRYKRTGSFLVMLSVVFVAAITTFVVVLRATLDDDNDSDNNQQDDNGNNNLVGNVGILGSNNNNNKNTEDSTTNLFEQSFNGTATSGISLNSTSNIESNQQQQQQHQYQFIIAYLIELILTYFVYYPIVGTILFSGILSCGKYPVIGGRPHEVRQEQIQAEVTEARKQAKQRHRQRKLEKIRKDTEKRQLPKKGGDDDDDNGRDDDNVKIPRRYTSNHNLNGIPSAVHFSSRIQDNEVCSTEQIKKEMERRRYKYARTLIGEDECVALSSTSDNYNTSNLPQVVEVVHHKPNEDNTSSITEYAIHYDMEDEEITIIFADGGDEEENTTNKNWHHSSLASV